MDGAIDVTTAAVGDVLFTGLALPLSMSALDQKRTFAVQKGAATRDVRLGPIADIGSSDHLMGADKQFWYT